MAALRLPVPRAVVLAAPRRPAPPLSLSATRGLRWQAPFGAGLVHQRPQHNHSTAPTAAAGGVPEEHQPGAAPGPESSSSPAGSSDSHSGSTSKQPQQQQQSEQPPSEQQTVVQQQAGSATAASSGAAASPSTAGTAGEESALDGAPGAAAALATFFRVLADTLRVLLRLLLVEPLGWVLNRCGLLAIRAGEVVAMLERTNRVAPIEPDRLAASLRVLNAHHPRATVEVRPGARGRGNLPARGRAAVAGTA